MEVRDTRYNDVRLIFKEENHKYTDTLGNEYKSTTTLLHEYAPKFDKDYWLKKKAKELHISEEKLAQQWETITKEACEQGTSYHNELEDGIINERKSMGILANTQNLEKALFGELDAVEKYRRILGTMPSGDSYTLIMSILTDELRHASKYNYLIHKASMQNNNE